MDLKTSDFQDFCLICYKPSSINVQCCPIISRVSKQTNARVKGVQGALGKAVFDVYPSPDPLPPETADNRPWLVSGGGVAAISGEGARRGA